MTFYIVKILVTTALVVAVSEMAERSTLAGGILASVPIVSVLAMIWLYFETGDAQRVAALSTGVFWLVIPSLALFLILPALLHRGVVFPIGLGVSVAATIGCYFAMIAILPHIGVRLD